MFKGLPQGIEVMRYHSLVVEESSLPKDLIITARVGLPSEALPRPSEAFGEGGAKEGEIMGLRHTKYPIEGIQFHPESFATEGGKQIIMNFLK